MRLLLLAATLALAGARPPADGMRVRLTESYRLDAVTQSVTTGSGSSSSSGGAGRSSFALEAEVPLRTAGRIDGDSPFRMKIGDFEFAGKPGGDPRYKPGASTATLLRLDSAAGSGLSYVGVKAVLRWSSRALSVRLTATGRSDDPVIAHAFDDAGEGTLEGRAEVAITFGAQETKATVPLAITTAHGSKYERVGPTDVSTDTKTIEIRGDTKES